MFTKLTAHTHAHSPPTVSFPLRFSMFSGLFFVFSHTHAPAKASVGWKSPRCLHAALAHAFTRHNTHAHAPVMARCPFVSQLARAALPSLAGLVGGCPHMSTLSLSGQRSAQRTAAVEQSAASRVLPEHTRGAVEFGGALAPSQAEQQVGLLDCGTLACTFVECACSACL